MDLIDRQAAIHDLCKIRCGCEPGKCGLTLEEDGAEECADVRWLLSLPSAEPNLQPSCNQLATDCISRQAAIDEIRRWIGYIDEDMITRIQIGLKKLPSAESRKGKWLRYGEDGYPNEEDTVFWQCDQCLEQYTGRTTRIPNFCPNCGADMRDDG